MNNTTTISRTHKFVQGIQDDDTVDHEDIGTCGFYFVKKNNNTGWIYLLNILIHMWPDNLQENPDKMQYIRPVCTTVLG